ncbi:MAG: hypothetical protein K8U57_39355 [Planctomycetes bacterium]|nr:hypothetical protein [Planctomycetota bacterium]
MARIRIEDLPTVTDLNAEELEEIFGAGRFSFKPAFENLGAREMMDAGIGGALMSNLARMPDTGVPLAEQTRVLDSATTFDSIDVRATPRGEAAPVALAAQATRPGAAPTEAAINKVTDEAYKFLRFNIIAGGSGDGKFANVWGLYKDGRESLIKTEVVGQEIRLTFSVYNRAERDPAKVQLNFTGNFENGVKTYTLSGAGLHDYSYSFLSPAGIPGLFEGEAKANFKRNYSNGIRVEVDHPDMNKFAESVAQQAAHALGASPYKVRGVELFDGGIRVVLERGERITSDDPYQRQFGQDHRYTDSYSLEFTYSASDLKAGIVTLDRAEKFADKSWRHSSPTRGYPWNNDGREGQNWSNGELEALKAVRWTTPSK